MKVKWNICIFEKEKDGDNIETNSLKHEFMSEMLSKQFQIKDNI